SALGDGRRRRPGQGCGGAQGTLRPHLRRDAGTRTIQDQKEAEARGPGGPSGCPRARERTCREPMKRGAPARSGKARPSVARGELAFPLALDLIALAPLPVARAQAPAANAPPTPRPPTFEVGIEVIRLSVSVTDARSHYVSSLAKNDFAVFEDGVRQEL